ncbi:MAG: ATP-binding protein [Actinomycetota bacterium]|nr:ATP-binding protein [Actinomycetota bacterium]
MSLRSSQTNNSIRQLAIYASTLTGIITLTIGTLLVFTASSTELRLASNSISHSEALLQSIPSIASGITTNNTKVEITKQTSKELMSLCSVNELAFVFFPSYLALTPTKPTLQAITTSTNTVPTTTVSVPSPQHLQDLTNLTYRSPNEGNSFCTATIKRNTPLHFRYFALSDGKSQAVAIVEIIALGHPLYFYIRYVLSKVLFALIFVGTLTSLSLWYLYRRNLAATFGLSSAELSSLIQEQEALLKGISEGVIACDTNGEVRFFNAESRRLIGIPERSIGRPLKHLIRGRRLRQIVTGEVSGRDLPVVVGRSILSISRLPVERDGKNLGHVITIQDRTEWEGLLRELDGMVGMTEALRAQAHEFSNKIHTIVGLIELGESAEAINFALNLSTRESLTNERLEEIDDPLLRALIIAKSAVTSERGVTLGVTNETRVHGALKNSLDILTVVGNLIDNALDAVLSKGEPETTFQSSDDSKWIELDLETIEDDLYITVTDSGCGVPNALLSSIFTDGYSTKVAGRGYRRGLGLALVAQIAAKYNGDVEVENIPGASFTVSLRGVLDNQS